MAIFNKVFGWFWVLFFLGFSWIFGFLGGFEEAEHVFGALLGLE